MRNLAAVFVAAALLAGCGGDDSGGGGGGGGQTTTIQCLFAGDTCDEITAVLTSQQLTQLSTQCTQAGGSYAVGACSTAGTVSGYCYYTGAQFTSYVGIDIPGATLKEYFFTAGGWTLQDAQAWCGLPPAGTWVP